MKLHQKITSIALSTGLAFCVVGASQALPFLLTSEALSLGAGNYGQSMNVAPGLKLTSKTMIGSDRFPSGIDGTVFLGEADYGIGVQNKWGHGSRALSSTRFGTEALEFNLGIASSAADIEVGLNKFETWLDDVSVNVRSSDGAWTKITDQSAIEAAFHQDGHRSGTLRFSEIKALEGLSVDLFAIESTKGHFFVNALSVSDMANPVPEPATLWLLGTGALGLAGFGLRQRRRRSQN